MLPYFLVFLLCAVRTLRVMAQGNWTTTPFNPPSMPLAVRSPYLNAWAPLGVGTAGSAPTYNAWPRTWDATDGNAGWILGWYAAVRVDGQAYNLLGGLGMAASTDAVQKSFYFSPTRSSYLFQAGAVNVNMTFMTSIEPTDLVRQSMPFTYLYFDFQSNDGNAHNVQVYSDISGEWIGGDNGLGSNWTINEQSNFVYLEMGLSSPGPFQELNARPMDGTAYYCIKKGSGVTWQIGPADDIRGFFTNGTGLKNTAEASFHGVGVPYFDTMGIAVDLGRISSTSEPVSYALGVVRDPVMQYTNELVQTVDLRAYYWTQFSSIRDVIADVINHFDDALVAAIALDNKILSEAGQITQKYAEILALATRQAMGALEYTVRYTNNDLDVKAFIRDMGTVGSGGVNAVDVLYASMPVYLYLNPNILGYLLSPMLRYQKSTQYTNPYAARDIGGSFPNATGNPNGHDQKIEHTASMLIMCLAHAQASGNGSLLAQNYGLLNSWASYLVNNTMDIGAETTSISDGISSRNQTNLVLKGIIGIGAMAKISSYTGHSDDQSHYDGLARQYIQQWTSLASGSGQLNLNFGSSSSGLIYNLYADKLLQLNLVDSSVYSLQTTFYQQQTQLWQYGIPLDTSNSSSITRSDWMMFAASTATDGAVRNNMIAQVHAYASVNRENAPFPVVYHPDNGTWTGGLASPAQGAMFAPLALNVPIKSVNVNGGAGGGSSRSNVAVIVGATVGGVAGLAIIAGIFFFIRRRRLQKQATGMYNRTDKIQHIKPATLNGDSVLEPLSTTVHPGMQDIRYLPYPQQSNDSTTFAGGSSTNVTSYPASVPFHVRNFTEGEMPGVGETTSAVASSSAVGGSSGAETILIGSAGAAGPQRPKPKNREHQEELRSEVDSLRREIERMKEERVVLVEPPPSYDDGLDLNPNPWSRSSSVAR